MLSFPSAINSGGISNVLYDKNGRRAYANDDNASQFDVSRIKAMNINLNPTIKKELMNDNTLDISMNNYRIKPKKFVNSGATQLQGQGAIDDNEYMTWTENPFQIPASILSTMNRYTRVYKTPVNNLMNAGAEESETAAETSNAKASDSSSANASSGTETNNSSSSEGQTSDTQQAASTSTKKKTAPSAVEVIGLKTKVVSSIFNPIHVIQVNGLLDNLPLINMKTTAQNQELNLANDATTKNIMDLWEKHGKDSINGKDEKGKAKNGINDFYKSFLVDENDKESSGLIKTGNNLQIRVNWDPFNNALIDNSANCTIRELVNRSHTPNGILGMAKYKYADFLFCKNIGKVSNNHMITLRRFAHPVGDNIFRFSGKGYLNERMPGYHGHQENGSIGTLITWFGTDDNKLEDILSYSVQSTWKEFQAGIQEIDTFEEDNAASGVIGMFANSFNPAYNSLVARGMAGSNSLWTKTGSAIFGATIGKIPGLGGKDATGGSGVNANSMKQWDLMRMSADKNKIYTPQNTIQATHKYEGKLILQHEFTLNFSYRLRALDVMNPKTVMLDLIGNILEVTYNRGHFWGGARRFIGPPRNASGVAKANAFIDRQWEKLEGFMQGFANGTIEWKSILSSLSDMVSQAVGAIKEAVTGKGGFAETFMSGAKKLAGKFVSSGASRAILGQLKNSLGRPAVYAMDSLLDGSPVGLWHVTIGNPKNPIAAFGNMIMTNAKITHSGPLGFDDFPTELKVSCTLKHGRSRDLSEVARMYTKGSSAFYNALDKNKLSEFFTVSNTAEGREVETTLDLANFVRGINEKNTALEEEKKQLIEQKNSLQDKKKEAEKAQNEKNKKEKEADKNSKQDPNKKGTDKKDTDKKETGKKGGNDKGKGKTEKEPEKNNNKQEENKKEDNSSNTNTVGTADQNTPDPKEIQKQIDEVDKRIQKIEEAQAVATETLKDPKNQKFLGNDWSSVYGDVSEEGLKKLRSNTTLYQDEIQTEEGRGSDNLRYGHYIRDEWALRYETLGQDLDTEGRILIDENA